MRSFPIAFLASALFLVACDSAPEGVEDGATELGGIVLEDDAMAAQLDSASGISLAEGQVHQQQARFLELSTAFEQQTGVSLSGVRLSERQADLLEGMLADEEDVTTKGLLQEILDTKEQITELEDEIDQIKSELPTPDIVGRGDTHLGLASEYLEKTHGLSKEEADRLARRSLLTNNLAPGMEVWHFYADGVYGTTVTQGTARVSPFFLNIRETRQLRQERDDALALATSLEAEITVLEATRDQLQEDITRVSRQRDDLRDERDVLLDDKADLVQQDESVHFYVDTRRRLREKDILAPAGMRLKEWRKDLFTQKMDLRTKSSLKVYAEDFGVRRLNKVILLPRSRFREDSDYQVQYDETRKVATIYLDNIDRFKNDAFVVVLK